MASGTYGTSDWYITYDGVLHIGSGTFRSTSEINPWSRYRLKNCVRGNVIAGEDSSIYLVTPAVRGLTLLK